MEDISLVTYFVLIMMATVLMQAKARQMQMRVTFTSILNLPSILVKIVRAVEVVALMGRFSGTIRPRLNMVDTVLINSRTLRMKNTAVAILEKEVGLDGEWIASKERAELPSQGGAHSLLQRTAVAFPGDGATMEALEALALAGEVGRCGGLRKRVHLEVPTYCDFLEHNARP
mmetsp:Transcript_35281/g.91679  ORF Transcript_35281/g.91679 Transcript_35281/m.91679 type:complete len:173 (+) Transcript_35281:2661-3179(+)